MTRILGNSICLKIKIRELIIFSSIPTPAIWGAPCFILAFIIMNWQTNKRDRKESHYRWDSQDMARHHSVVRSPICSADCSKMNLYQASQFDALSSSEYSDHSYWYLRIDDRSVQWSS